jgi:hypothetical protein
VRNRITKRLVLSWIHLAFIALGLTVLCWGTGYKVSLYYPPQSAVRSVPCAKLLSRNEQLVTDTREDDMPTPQPVPVSCVAIVMGFLSLLLAFAARHFLAAFASRSCRETGRCWHLHQRISMSFFFVLPPPAVA